MKPPIEPDAQPGPAVMAVPGWPVGGSLAGATRIGEVLPLGRPATAAPVREPVSGGGLAMAAPVREPVSGGGVVVGLSVRELRRGGAAACELPPGECRAAGVLVAGGPARVPFRMCCVAALVRGNAG